LSFENENTCFKAKLLGTFDEIGRRFDAAVEVLLHGFKYSYPNYVGGIERRSAHEFEVISPIDSTIQLGSFQKMPADQAKKAVEASRHAFAEWRNTSWLERVNIFEKAADMMADEKFSLAAAITLNNGKNRYEAVADVDEAIDFIRYYCQQMRENEGYDREMLSTYPDETVRSVLRPYGVFAVICPFNYPVAITTGMMAGALITGNTVVLKPSSAVPLPPFLLYEVFRRAGVPDGVINLVTGPGDELGDALVHSDVDGIVFTGSRAVGERMIMSAASRERHVPVIAEMGGKNAIIVTEKADLDKAVEGVAKAAFGYSGQKCSACSRLFVHSKVYDTFVSKLVEYTASLKVGDPLEKDTFTGPVISEAKVKQFLQCADMAGKDGRVLTGGKRISSEFLEQGNYVELTIVDSLPDDHYLMRTELFLPFLCVTRADSLEDAIARANAVDYGLTAGIFSEDADELYAFFRDIEAGVVYANRRRSGSSGAMVGSQAFGGWKASGSTGKGTGSVYYLQQFMREQSRTVVRP